MDASKPSPLSSFKPKKSLHFNAGKEGSENPVLSSDKEAEKVPTPSESPWSVKTPGKEVNTPRRLRQRSAAMSIKEVRMAAMAPRERRSGQPSTSNPELYSKKEPVAKPKKMSVHSATGLPDEYKLLYEFFKKLDTSIRLLRLWRHPPTFTNIRSQVERLTDRRFTHSHLAQLRFIMPEAIVVEKVIRHDESTSCMKPDLLITLNAEAIGEQSKSESSRNNLQLSKVFCERLQDFYKSHPEGDQVPEGELPEPFSKLKKDLNKNLVQSSVPLSIRETQGVATVTKSHLPSHLPLSFEMHFSREGSTHLTENRKQHQSSVSAHALGSEHELAESPSGKETTAIAVIHSELALKPSSERYCSSNMDSSGSTPLSPLPETPVKCINSMEYKDQSSLETAPALQTPVDHVSTPIKLMSATPGLRPPKRCCMSPDGSSTRLSNKLARRPPPNRPLTFSSPVKSVKKVDDKFGKSILSSADDDIYDILPEDLLQSIQEKERLANMEKDPAISQAKRRKQMIDSLPQFFDMIYFLFQSIRRTAITKEELIQKIITGNLAVVDRRDVEEQLRLLQELAPDWIYEKTAKSGDLLVCVNNIPVPAIHAQLSEAKREVQVITKIKGNAVFVDSFSGFIH